MHWWEWLPFKWPYREVRVGFLFIDEKPFLIFRCTRMANSFVDQPDRFLHGRQLQIFALDDPRCVFDHLARWKSARFDQPSDNHLTNFKFLRRVRHGHPRSPKAAHQPAGSTGSSWYDEGVGPSTRSTYFLHLALERYVREVRPKCQAEALFVRLRAPHRQFTAGSMYAIVGDRMKRLKIESPRPGPHGLRHACATHLLAQGLTLTEVGGHLGHSSADSTRVYAKVDMPRLREVAELDLGGLL